MATTTKNRGLGKGLSALISDNYVQPAEAKKAAKASAERPLDGGASTLPIGKLHASKYQPRTRFDDEALSELAESIRAHGVVQPIIARPSAQKSGTFEIIAGERRWRAAQMAGLESIPVIVREITDRQALELALVENVQRRDLSPLEEATGYQRLIDEFKYTQEELASTVGKSRSYITNILRLHGLPDEVKQLLESGDISAGHARALLMAPNPTELAQAIVAKKLNVRQAEQYAQDAKAGRKESAPKSTRGSSRPGGSSAGKEKNEDILALEASLSENLGIRVSINDRGQSGEIILAYDSLAQLDDILKRLNDGI